MSHIKHEMEMDDAQRKVALAILVKVGALDQCPVHEEIYYDGGGNAEDAYKLGNWRFSHQQENYDHAMECFDNPREMTDAIKEAYEEFFPADGCPMCEKD